MDSQRPTLPTTVIKGRTVRAVYIEPECADYVGNLLEEALPPILTDDQASSRLSYYPQYHKLHRKAEDHVRYLLIQNGLKFFACLDIHIDLYRRFSNLIRVGYAGRNPFAIGFWGGLRSKLNSFDQYSDQYEDQPDRLPSTAAGFNIVGPSGSGKSFSVERTLSLFPQVIHHNSYREHTFTHSQLVWLKLDCPFDGNIRGLCIQFFRTVDSILGTTYATDYVRDRRIQDELLSDMRAVAATHFLGVLVIDEIQRLSLAKSGGADKMLNFFVQLINELGVPVVLIGNYKAIAVLSGDFSQMRRGTGQGDMIWDLLEKDDQWQLFVESLWRYQYTRKVCKRDDKAVRSSKDLTTLSDVLYEETQGITDFAVKVFMFAQERAIDSGKELITGSVIRSVAADKIRIPRSVIQAIKANDVRALERYEDLYTAVFKNYLHERSREHLLDDGMDQPADSPSPPAPPLQRSDTQTPDNRVGSHEKKLSERGSSVGHQAKQEKHKARNSSKKSASTKGKLQGIIKSLGKGHGTEAYAALKAAGLIKGSDGFLKEE